jgi:hypothetical protein
MRSTEDSSRALLLASPRIAQRFLLRRRPTAHTRSWIRQTGMSTPHYATITLATLAHRTSSPATTVRDGAGLASRARCVHRLVVGDRQLVSVRGTGRERSRSRPVESLLALDPVYVGWELVSWRPRRLDAGRAAADADDCGVSDAARVRACSHRLCASAIRAARRSPGSSITAPRRTASSLRPARSAGRGTRVRGNALASRAPMSFWRGPHRRPRVSAPGGRQLRSNVRTRWRTADFFRDGTPPLRTAPRTALGVPPQLVSINAMGQALPPRCMRVRDAERHRCGFARDGGTARPRC